MKRRIEVDTITQVEHIDTSISTRDTATPSAPAPELDIEIMGEVCVPMPEPPIMGKVSIPDSSLVELTAEPVFQGPDTNKVYQYAEMMPEYPGGFDSLTNYLSTKLISISGAVQAEGRVIVTFVVDLQGRISDIQFVRSFDEAQPFHGKIEKAIEEMPRWKPGKMNGHDVKVRTAMPIQFR